MQPITKPLPRCADCALVYGSTGWVDAVVPDKVWQLISPTGGGGGLLCFNCIARRLEIWGLGNVPVHLGSNLFAQPAAAFDPEDVATVVGLDIHGDPADW